MEHSTHLAHISEDGTRTQTVYDHLAGTARLAGSFAAPFGAQSEAEFAAWLHDVGKYSDAFQLRLKGGPGGGPLHRRGAGGLGSPTSPHCLCRGRTPQRPARRREPRR